MRAAALLMALALLGCKERREEPAAPPGAALPPPTPMTESEATTGREACAKYAEQVCRCAAQMKDLEPECAMAASRGEALEMNVRAAMAEGDATAEDRRVLLANARKIMRACIEDASALVVRGCPLEAPEGAAPAAPAPAEPAPPARR